MVAVAVSNSSSAALSAPDQTNGACAFFNYVIRTFVSPPEPRRGSTYQLHNYPASSQIPAKLPRDSRTQPPLPSPKPILARHSSHQLPRYRSAPASSTNRHPRQSAGCQSTLPRAMPLDSLSFTAPARLRALLCPLGRIKRSRFSSFSARLQNSNVVRLGDVTPDPKRSKVPEHCDGRPCDASICVQLTDLMVVA